MNFECIYLFVSLNFFFGKIYFRNGINVENFFLWSFSFDIVFFLNFFVNIFLNIGEVLINIIFVMCNFLFLIIKVKLVILEL